MKFGYARVSTKDQNLTMQLDALKAQGCEKIFMEKESGAKDDRPERQKLFDQLRKGDAVVVYNLSRFSRSQKDLFEKLETLREMGVEFLSIEDGIFVSDKPAGKLHLSFVAAINEFNRAIILENTNAGLKAARARGRVGGRKEKLTPKQKKEIIEVYNKGGIPVTQLAKTYAVNRNTIYNIVNQAIQ
ncbi:recombinase family protein [Runella sp.]|uniref:recombinase family protein n=1 Tax=Runella sp. TaxID=1960881 RepID=UPI003D0A12B4